MQNKILQLFSILIVINFFQTACFAQKEYYSFEIEGEISAKDTHSLILRFKSSMGMNISDTCIVEGGKFNFKGDIKEPTLAVITGNVKTNKFEDPNTCRFFIEPGKIAISLTEDAFSNAKISGSATQDELNLLKSQYKEQKDDLEILLERRAYYTKKINTIALKDSITFFGKKRDSIQRLVVLTIKEKDNKILNFIANHPKSYASPYLFYPYIGQSSIPTTLILSTFNSFSKKVKESPLGIDNFKGINDRLTRESIATSKVNIKNEPIILSDDKNQLRDISTMLGKKFTLIDFWASWCLPCIKSNPHVKKIANLYAKEGLKVIAISTDRNRKDWLPAIYEHGYDQFINLIDLPNRLLTLEDLQNMEKIPLLKRWNVVTIPTLMLFDNKGAFIAKFDRINLQNQIVGLEEKLKELYNDEK
ncbi:DUF4369 domain-containing protein [Pedobacter sp. MW01-1-1]|uniref:DUF4369 domain-containing protein n=1 Tax=Pedobacter sp. MW01-1-1 TaxID=3383027 RepID=UPI003FF0EBD7